MTKVTTAIVSKCWAGRDYCFVTTKDGRNAHMHASACNEFSILRVGTEIDCELVAKPDGRWSVTKAHVKLHPGPEEEHIRRTPGLQWSASSQPNQGFVVVRRRVSSGWHFSPAEAQAALRAIASSSGCNAVLDIMHDTDSVVMDVRSGWRRTTYRCGADACLVVEHPPQEPSVWLAARQDGIRDTLEAIAAAEALHGATMVTSII